MFHNPEVVVYFWLMLVICLAILPAFFATCSLVFDVARKLAALVMNSSVIEHVMEDSEEEVRI